MKSSHIFQNSVSGDIQGCNPFSYESLFLYKIRVAEGGIRLIVFCLIFFIFSASSALCQESEPQTDKRMKAIIVAGGDPLNETWAATGAFTKYAYQELIRKGFTKEDVFYLNSDTEIDLDSDGESDVDSDATNMGLEQAITEWATDAESLVVYLIGPGDEGIFHINNTETMSAEQLDNWLDTLQETFAGNVIVIYDADDSGSFLPLLIPPENRNRIVITSTSPGQQGTFINMTQGIACFSNYFWSHIFNGFNIRDAFGWASQAIKFSDNFSENEQMQMPMIDDNGNGIGNEKADTRLCRDLYIDNEKFPISESSIDKKTKAIVVAGGGSYPICIKLKCRTIFQIVLNRLRAAQCEKLRYSRSRITN
jgi:hypothetical protein